MKKKITLTINENIYNKLKEININVSSLLEKSFLNEYQNTRLASLSDTRLHHTRKKWI